MGWTGEEEPTQPNLLVPAELVEITRLDVPPAGAIEVAVWTGAFGSFYGRHYALKLSSKQLTQVGVDALYAADNAVAAFRKLRKV